MVSWDDEFAAFMGSAGGPGPEEEEESFIDRARAAPDDDDDNDIAMGDDPVRIGPAPGNGPRARVAVLGQDAAEETAFQQLIRHWMNERHAPDVLPGQEMLLGRILDHVRKQSNDVELLRADPDSSEEEHFRIMLVQTEIERVKFVVRSYIRTRLHKIEKYARYISSTPDMHERLSRAELEHANRYSRLVEYHFKQSVLQSLPEQQQSLQEDIVFMPPMVTSPDKQRPVVARALVDCPPMRLPDGASTEMKKGDISMTPYYVVEHLLLRGEVELV